MLTKTILIISLIGRQLSIDITRVAITAYGIQVRSSVQAEHRWEAPGGFANCPHLENICYPIFQTVV